MNISHIRINGFTNKSTSLFDAVCKLAKEIIDLEKIRDDNNLPKNYWVQNFDTSDFNLDFAFKQESVKSVANDFLEIYSLKSDESLGDGEIVIDVKIDSITKKITIYHEKKEKSSLADIGLTARTRRVEIRDF
ncbi:MAG: hypothetical protein Q4A21_02925 [bacterium]|nr:hypothetical protein [bacterium]